MAAFWNRTRPSPPGIRAGAEDSRQIDDYLTDQIPHGAPGLALGIVKSGAVVHAAGYGLADIQNGLPVLPDTIFHLASCGKQFTGLGILMLAEEGKLHPDDPLAKHLPALAGFGPRVTIRQLLHHTSGIRDLYDEESVDQVLARCERPTNADLVGIYAELGCPMAGRATRPGDTFSYSNSGYDLLGSVIEAVSGQSYHDFFQSRVFDPLGMKDTFSAPDNRAGDRRCATGYDADESGQLAANGGSAFDALAGSGSFYTTLPDLFAYERSLRSYGLIKEASTLEMFASGRTNDGVSTRYGFGWFIGSYDGAALADHEGAWNGFRSYICCYLDEPFSIFVLTNNPEIDLLEIANLVSDVYG
jgi:CubicO group peptidase (beta-lactamase class C family)